MVNEVETRLRSWVKHRVAFGILRLFLKYWPKLLDMAFVLMFTAQQLL